MKKKLSILLAGVCLTAALYSAGTTYGQNKTNSAKQKEDTVTTNKYQGVTIKDKAKGKVTKQQVRELKKEHLNNKMCWLYHNCFPKTNTVLFNVLFYESHFLLF